MATTLPNQTMSLPDFMAIRDFIYGRTGIFFSESKQYFLENRLNRRVQEMSLPSYRDYLGFLQGPQTEEHNQQNGKSAPHNRRDATADGFAAGMLIPRRTQRA